VEKPGRFVVRTGSGGFEADSLVVATGGLSVPEAGASDFGYRVARGFGLAVTETAPALVGFRLSEELLRKLSPLSGVSLAATVKVGKTRVNDQLLFTHWGLSGPAVLKASLLWRPGLPVEIDLLPDTKLGDWLGERKKSGEKSIVKNLLTRIFPDRIAKTFTDLYLRDDRPLVEIPDKTLEAFGDRVNRWKPEPSGTMGYERAEVTRGGVDTRELSSQTMESRKVPGLYFVGEVVDVTGQLGGYNFQWAWASGWAAGQVV
jgi:predicted Rossmann fold flavoprotein